VAGLLEFEQLVAVKLADLLCLWDETMFAVVYDERALRNKCR
jgi:hypothetical protein